MDHGRSDDLHQALSLVALLVWVGFGAAEKEEERVPEELGFRVWGCGGGDAGLLEGRDWKTRASYSASLERASSSTSRCSLRNLSSSESFERGFGFGFEAEFGDWTLLSWNFRSDRKDGDVFRVSWGFRSDGKGRDF